MVKETKDDTGLLATVYDLLNKEEDLEDAVIDDAYRGAEGLSPDIPREARKLERIHKYITDWRDEATMILKRRLGILVERLELVEYEDSTSENIVHWNRNMEAGKYNE